MIKPLIGWDPLFMGSQTEKVKEIQRQTLEVSDYTLPSTEQGGVIPYVLGTRLISRPSVIGYGYAANNGITPVFETKIEETTEDEQAVGTMSTTDGKDNPDGWRYDQAPGYGALAAAVERNEANGYPSNAAPVSNKNGTLTSPRGFAPATQSPLTPNKPRIGWSAPHQVVTVKDHTINTITTLAGYTFDLMLCICLGEAVRLRKIYSGETLLWEGDLMSNPNGTGAEVDTSALDKQPLGAGFIWHSGYFVQEPDTYLKSKAVEPDKVPGFPGVAYVVLKNIKSENVGQAAFSFEVTRIPEPLNIPRSMTTPNERDMNPAVAIAAIMSEQWGGLALDNLDLQGSFVTAAKRLDSEGHNVSALVINEGGTRNTLNSLKEQTMGALFAEPNSGLINYRLYRQDDSAADVLDFDVSKIVQVQSPSRVDWIDVPTHFKIGFLSRNDKYDSKSFVEENPSSVANDPEVIGSRQRKVASYTYDELCNENAAKAVMMLNIKQNAFPTWQMTLVCKRDAADLLPTDKITITWPDLQLYGAEFWVTRRRENGDMEQVMLDVRQLTVLDVPPYVVVPQPSEAVSTKMGAKLPASVRVIDIPYFLAKKAGLAQRYIMPNYYGDALILAEAADDYQTNLTVYNGDNLIVNQEGVNYCSTATLVNDIAYTDGMQEGIIKTLWFDNFKLAGKLFDQGPNGVERGDIFMFLNDEILAFEKIEYDTASGKWKMINVHRALLDTVEAPHNRGDVIYFYDTGDKTRIFQGGMIVNQDSRRLRFVGNSLGQTGRIAEVPLENDIIFAPNGRLNAPLRPHRLTINDVRDDKVRVFNQGQQVHVQWKLRTRDYKTVVKVNDPNQPPEVMLEDSLQSRNPIMYLYLRSGNGTKRFIMSSFEDYEQWWSFHPNMCTLTYANFTIPADIPTGEATLTVYAVQYDYHRHFNFGFRSPDAVVTEAYKAVEFKMWIEPAPTFFVDFTHSYGLSVTADFTHAHTFDY